MSHTPHHHHDGHIGHGHIGHGLGDGSVAPVPPRIRHLLIAVVVPLLLATVVGMVALWPDASRDTDRLSGPRPASALIAATVQRLEPGQCESVAELERDIDECTTVHLRLSGGAPASFVMSAVSGIRVQRGDNIYVESFDVTTQAGQSERRYSFYEFKRERPVALLVGAFVLSAIAIGRRRGARALVALAVSLVVLVKFILPSILDGHSPLLVALVGSSAIMFLALYLSHGVNVRSTSAVIGTLASLAITGLLSSIAVGAARFTGLAGDEANLLRTTVDSIDVRGLLLAGIIIGALGVLDDVTVTQASAVWELHRANPSMGVVGTYRAALRIGRDHIASTVNTLVLAYAGASLPLLLLFSQSGTPIGEVLNGEPVATEIVRMMAGSIGLMASVPITTALTAFLVSADRSQQTTPSAATATDPDGTGIDGTGIETSVPFRPPRAERAFRGDD